MLWTEFSVALPAMDRNYASGYGELARAHWWWRARDAAVLAALDRWVPTCDDGRVLDVGCGDGRMFGALRRYGVVEGIEPDPVASSACPVDGRIHNVAFSSPLPVAGPYRLITMLDVLEHLDDARGALALCAELLTPDGVLCLTVPAMPWLWTAHDDINHHRIRFTPRSLHRAAHSAGLTIRWSRYLFHSLILPKLAVRLAEQVRGPGVQVPRVPPAALNRAAEAAFRLETRITAPIASWLPGSSLIAIVAKH